MTAQLAEWWWRAHGLDRRFLRFLGASGLFTFGMFLFVLIYNLYLLDLGFQEDFLGKVAGAMTAGSIAGALPAGWLGHRAGLGRTLLLCFGGSAVITAGRAAFTAETWLIASAFIGGAFLALWMVSMAPVVARLVAAEHRPVGFSLFFGAGIGLGIAGGLIGGRLPELLLGLGAADTGAAAKRWSLLAGAGFMALAGVVIARLDLPAGESRQRKVYPRGAFIRRYLLVFALWNLATGAFNPFFNAFLSRLGATTAQIGAVFSSGQVAQLVAMIVAPVAYRRFGLVPGIAAMMVLTGAALGLVSISEAVLAGALAYCFYMAFQWMSEPGMYTLLMSNVRDEEQSGASSLNFLTIASAQALAAFSAGTAIHHFGYATVLAVAGLAAISAGLLLCRLLTGSGAGSRQAATASAKPAQPAVHKSRADTGQA